MRTFKKLMLIEVKSRHREEGTNKTGIKEVHLISLSERLEEWMKGMIPLFLP